MVTFLTFFLGLVVSVHPVEVAAAGAVARVEYQVDGELAGVAEQAPWRAEVDFGEALLPHELVAVARDADGTELGRARQWVNLPRSRAEAGFLLGEVVDGRPRRVEVLSDSLDRRLPESVTVTFDGEPLAALGPDEAAGAAGDHVFRLPEYDPETVHVLSAELVFEGNLRTRVEAALGGTLGSEMTVDMTAVPLVVERRAPGLGELDGKLVLAEEPLRPLALERGQAEVVVVLERSALLGLGQHGLALDRLGGRARDEHRLRPGEQVRFLSAYPVRLADRSVPVDLFPISSSFTSKDGNLPFLFTHVNMGENPGGQRVADAVATAAVQAAAGNRPRAVVLVVGPSWQDASRFSVDEVRGYLEALRVPLVVWSTGQVQSRRLSEDRRPISTRTPWGTARDISSVPRFLRSVEDLRRELDRQMIVWVEGSHLPPAIELVDPPRGVALAR